MTTTYSTYRLGDVASLIFLPIENIPPHFSVHVYYGQMAGWIRILLGTQVRLGSGDIVLDGDPAPPPRKGTQQPPTFRPLLWSASPQARITHTRSNPAGLLSPV